MESKWKLSSPFIYIYSFSFSFWSCDGGCKNFNQAGGTKQGLDYVSKVGSDQDHQHEITILPIDPNKFIKPHALEER